MALKAPKATGEQVKRFASMNREHCLAMDWQLNLNLRLKREREREGFFFQVVERREKGSKFTTIKSSLSLFS